MAPERRDITDDEGRLIISDSDQGSGSKDRATVALVDAKVDGLRELIRAEFGYVKERIAPIAKLEDAVSRLTSQSENHERRLQGLEQDKKAERDWRRDRLPALIIAAAVAAGSLIATITQLH